MPRYHYHALNAEGISLEGMLRADNERDVARQLERRGLSVVEVRSGEAAGRERRGRLRHGDVILALQELATMLTSGVSIADAVGSQALGAHHPRIVAAFTIMSRDLQRGLAFSATLAKCGLPLPEYVVQLARAGELTGELGRALRDASTQLEYEQQLRNEMRNALIYPAVLVLAGVAARRGPCASRSCARAGWMRCPAGRSSGRGWSRPTPRAGPRSSVRCWATRCR